MNPGPPFFVFKHRILDLDPVTKHTHRNQRTSRVTRTNICLNVIGDQLDKIENKIDSINVKLDSIKIETPLIKSQELNPISV
jgi:NifB/MoaA-like Fe-S oxidoreductase